MKLIDAHAHIFEHLAGFGRRGEQRALGKGRIRWATGEEVQIIPPTLGDKEFTPESLLTILDAHHVEKAVLLQGHFYGFQNDYVKEAVEKYPTRLIGSGILDPYCVNAAEILQYLLDDLGYRILKFEFSTGAGLMGYHPDFKIDGPEMKLIWTTAAERELVVVLDPGSVGMPSFQIDGMANVVKRFPKVRLVVTHLLAPPMGSDASLFPALRTLKHDRIWFDLSALPWNVSPEAYPYPTSVKYIAEAKRIVGAEHLIWGTDVPGILTIATYQQLIDFVTTSEVFIGSELDAVMGANAADVYGL
jgi:predicted TIM-barrel fold metal-dependent hydrolase